MHHEQHGFANHFDRMPALRAIIHAILAEADGDQIGMQKGLKLESPSLEPAAESLTVLKVPQQTELRIQGSPAPDKLR